MPSSDHIITAYASASGTATHHVEFIDGIEMKRTIGSGLPKRYIVKYVEDTPERAEAVAFFRQSKNCLNQGDSVPNDFDLLSESDGQKYLDTHPISRIWNLLCIDGSYDCMDSDLERLRFIPELRIVRIHSDQVTDAGVARLRLLRAPEVLIIYSKAITDACLRDIAEMQSLRSLDLQGSPQISRLGFDSAVKHLPNLTDFYPPWEKE